MVKQALSRVDARRKFEEASAYLAEHDLVPADRLRRLGRLLRILSTDKERGKLVNPLVVQAGQHKAAVKREAARQLVSRRVRKLTYDDNEQLVGSRWLLVRWLRADWGIRLDRIRAAQDVVFEVVIDAACAITASTKIYARVQVVEKDGSFTIDDAVVRTIEGTLGGVDLEHVYADEHVRPLRQRVPDYHKWDLTKIPPRHPRDSYNKPKKGRMRRRFKGPVGARQCCVVKGVTRCESPPTAGSWYCAEHSKKSQVLDKTTETPKGGGEG